MNQQTTMVEAAEALKGASETLLIPLAARAVAHARYPQFGFRDMQAEALTLGLRVNLSRYAKARSSVIGCILRGQWFDRVCTRFITAHPGATVLSLGSGLNTMYERVARAVGDTPFRWIDSDLEDVVALRHALLPDTPQRRTMSLDLNEPALLEAIAPEDGTALLVVAEGLLMYLPRDSVERLFRELPKRVGARPLAFAFDWPSPAMARNGRRHPAVGRIKDRSVGFDWSLKRPNDIRTIDRKWRAVESHDVMSGSGAFAWTLQRLHRLITGGRWFYGCSLVEQR